MVGSPGLQDSQSLTPTTPAPHPHGRPPFRPIGLTFAAAHLDDHLALLLAPLHVHPHTPHATPHPWIMATGSLLYLGIKKEDKGTGKTGIRGILRATIS